MLLFLITNWRCLLKLGALAIISIVLLYSCHLSHKVDVLSSENDKLSSQVKYSNGYIQKYEDAKAENDAMTNTLLTQMENVKDDQKCLAPDPVRNVIKRLPR